MVWFGEPTVEGTRTSFTQREKRGKTTGRELRRDWGGDGRTDGWTDRKAGGRSERKTYKEVKPENRMDEKSMNQSKMGVKEKTVEGSRTGRQEAGQLGEWWWTEAGQGRGC